MTYRLAKNTGPVPVVVDDVGHQLGGGEWGPVRAATGRVKDLEAAGRIVFQDVDDAGTNREVADALEAVARYNERAGRAGALEPDVLASLLAENGIPEPAAMSSKDDLIEVVVRAAFDLPTPAARRRAAAE